MKLFAPAEETVASAEPRPEGKRKQPARTRQAQSSSGGGGSLSDVFSGLFGN